MDDQGIASPLLRLGRRLRSASSESSVEAISTWEAAVLFASFIIITLIWEFSTALLAWITVRFSGRRALWLKRLKDEILALGVITLTLIVISNMLSKICIPDGASSSEGVSTECPEGKQQLFSAHLIHMVHLLLFQVAVTFIVVTSLTFYASLLRMRSWRKWEKMAREGDQALRMDEEELLAKLGDSSWMHAISSLLGTVKSGVSMRIFAMLRVSFKFQMDKAADKKLPRSFNFLNLISQAMEVDFSEASEMSWVIFIIMSVFLVIPVRAHPIYFISGLAAITTLVVAAKLQSIAVVLAAAGYLDFAHELNTMHLEDSHAYTRNKSTKMELGRVLEVKGENDASTDGSLHMPQPAAHPLTGANQGKGSVKPWGSNKVAPDGAHMQSTAIEKMKQRVSVRFTVYGSKGTTGAQGHTTGGGTSKELPQGQPELRDTLSLFWFRSPQFISWVFQIAFMCTTIALTLTTYGLIQDGQTFIDMELGIGPVIIVLIGDIVILGYGAVNVMPMYALVATVASEDPEKLLAEIQKMKSIGSMEEFEQGIGGKILKLCLPSENLEEDLEKSEGLKAFVVLLSNQAGVIGRHGSDGEPCALNPDLLQLYENFLKVWAALSSEWHANSGRPSTTNHDLVADYRQWRDVFSKIDRDGSGSISRFEIASVLKAMGTRATAEELEDMVDALDVDNNGIEFEEFVLFIIFKFLDQNNDGFITRNDLQAAVSRTKAPFQESDLESLIDYTMKDREGDMRRRISLAEFIETFDEIIDLRDICVVAPVPNQVMAVLDELHISGKLTDTVPGLKKKNLQEDEELNLKEVAQPVAESWEPGARELVVSGLWPAHIKLAARVEDHSTGTSSAAPRQQDTFTVQALHVHGGGVALGEQPQLAEQLKAMALQFESGLEGGLEQMAAALKQLVAEVEGQAAQTQAAVPHPPRMLSPVWTSPCSVQLSSSKAASHGAAPACSGPPLVELPNNPRSPCGLGLGSPQHH